MRREYILPLFVVLVSLISPSVLSAQRKKLPATSNPKENVAQRLTVAQALASFRSSIVQINAISNTSIVNRTIIGTGFVVGDGNYVITNYHVVNFISNAPAFSLEVGFPQPNAEFGVQGRFVAGFTTLHAQVIDQDIEHDLALLKLERNPLSGLGNDLMIGGKVLHNEVGTARLLSGRPTEGAQLIVAGYPLNKPSLMTNSGYLASAWGLEIQAKQSLGVRFPSLSVSDVYYADIRVNRGNSGGPVFSIDDNGVIGVCVKNESEAVLARDDKGEMSPVYINNDKTNPLIYNAGIAWIIPASYVIKLLEKNKVPISR